jgi:hypothetical protein
MMRAGSGRGGTGGFGWGGDEIEDGWREGRDEMGVLLSLWTALIIFSHLIQIEVIKI